MKTDEPIVLTIFGGERCVTTLADLEVAARAIHRKAVRERHAHQRHSKHRGADYAQPPERQSVGGSNPSTLGAEIESRKTLINENSKPDGKAIL